MRKLQDRRMYAVQEKKETNRVYNLAIPPTCGLLYIRGKSFAFAGQLQTAFLVPIIMKVRLCTLVIYMRTFIKNNAAHLAK